MEKKKLDLILIVDHSSIDRSILASIKENIDEITSLLNSYVNQISLITFGNIPTTVYKSVTIDKINSFSFDQKNGGMCNVHFALRDACKLIVSSKENIVCLLLFLTTDPTDSIKILDEKCTNRLDGVKKYLIKKTSTLSEPLGFNGSRTYSLGSQEDIERLIRDIIDECKSI